MTKKKQVLSYVDVQNEKPVLDASEKEQKSSDTEGILCFISFLFVWNKTGCLQFHILCFLHFQTISVFEEWAHILYM